MFRIRTAAASVLLLAPVACEDGTGPGPTTAFTVTIENIQTAKPFFMAGVFNTPVGATAPSPAEPGQAFVFEFAAPPGARLSFASMFGQSNDLFYAPGPDGIALFNNGQPISGDVTSQIMLWDAGTEQNQEPGTGSNQAPRQPAPNTGPVDANRNVRLSANEFGNLPAVAAVMRATLTSLGGNRFRMRLENVGSATILPSSAGPMPAPFSPGVWVVHTATAPLFAAGAPDRGDGLERIAEDGNPASLADFLDDRAGVVTPLSPGAWVVHSTPVPIFTEGALDRGDGLERIAEDADPTMLAADLAATRSFTASGVFNTPVGASAPGPIMPGQRFQFTINARPGDRLSFVTMFGQSNDLFYSPGDDGIDLFTANTPLSGDVSTQIMLWDAGTEVNETPGAGPNQAPRQSGPDTGPSESRPIAAPSDGFTYPGTGMVLRVTITPGGN
jgi:hypothetical protein